jgi:hypothetical protein
VAAVHNNQRDGHMRQTINTSRTSYEPKTIGGGGPMQAGPRMGGFVSYPEPIDAEKARRRGEKFFDHFSQATLFYNSQSETEKGHIVQALRFELGKVEIPAIRERMVGMLVNVDRTLAELVAETRNSLGGQQAHVHPKTTDFIARSPSKLFSDSGTVRLDSFNAHQNLLRDFATTVTLRDESEHLPLSFTEYIQGPRCTAFLSRFVERVLDKPGNFPQGRLCLLRSTLDRPR